MDIHRRMIIFGHGTLCDVYLESIQKDDCIIGVDAAAFWLIKHHISPHLAIGDFDSVTKSELAGIKQKIRAVKKYPPDKDKTDLHLALDFALARRPQEILIFGALGTRVDHSLANINLLYVCSKKGIKAKIIDQNNEIRLVDKTCLLPLDKQYRYFSVIPFTNDAVVTIAGCRYPVRKKLIRRHETIGISNEVAGLRCRVRVHRGIVLIIRSRD